MPATLGYALVTLSALVTSMNWLMLFTDRQYRKNNIQKHASMIPLAPQILALLGATISGQSVLPYWAFVLLGLLDPSIHALAWLGLKQLGQRH